MRRRAWSGITLTSFILSILIGGVWLRSYIQLDLITRTSENELQTGEHLLAWSRGRVTMRYLHRLGDAKDVSKELSPLTQRWAWDVGEPIIIRTGRSTANRYGFTAEAGTSYSPATDERRGATWTKYGLVMPCWFLFLLSLILPGIAWYRGRARAMAAVQPPTVDPPLQPV